MTLDIVDKLIALFETEWDKSNTNNTTPQFISIEDKDSKTASFYKGKVILLFHRPVLRFEKNGVGANSKRARHLVRLDLRALGTETEDTYRKSYDELIRILDAHIINPVTGYQELDYEDETQQDLTDGHKGLYRIIVPVRLINYCISRG
jgi:hypothetical protein